ncbi:MAG: hypothetical protein WBM52_05645 [Thiogranum sp.]
MFDNKKIGDQHRNVCYRVDARMALCCVLVSGVMLPWGAYANAEEFATVVIGETANVNVHADSQPLAVQNLDAPAVVDVNDKESIPIDIDPDLSDVVQLDTSKGDQNSQLDLAGPRDMQSLGVVATGSTVDMPQAVVDVNGDQYISQEVDVDAVDQGGGLATGSDAALLVTSAPEEYQIHDVSVRHGQDDKKNDRPEDAAINAIGEEDSAGLPYAVLLALLSLIGLVPVARRNDHHRV